MFDANRAVEVISRGVATGLADGYGSGYYLGGGVVITCAHVLSENAGGELTVRDIKGRTVAARIAWCNDDHDVALLSVDDDGDLPQERVPLCVLPRITTDEVAKFVMYGWPKAGNVGSKRNPVQVHGPIKLAEVAGAKTGTVRLRPGEGSPPPQYWKGMSGAAVFCQEYLIAVQIMHPNPDLDYLEGRLLTKEVLQLPDAQGRQGTQVLTAAGIRWGATVAKGKRMTARLIAGLKTVMSWLQSTTALQSRVGTVTIRVVVVAAVLLGCGLVGTRLWDSFDDESRAPIDWHGTLRVAAQLRVEGTARGVSFSPDGESIAIAAGALDIWNLSDHTNRSRIQLPRELYDVSYSPDGRLLAGAGYNSNGGILRVWQVDDWNVVEEDLTGGSSYNHVAFRADNRTFATAGDHGVHLWKVGDGPFEGRQIVSSDDARDVAFSLNGTLLAACIGDAPNGRLEVLTYPGLAKKLTFAYSDVASSLAISRDGSFLAGGFRDGKLLMWNLKNVDAEPIVLQTAAWKIRALNFSPDGSLLASVSSSGLVRVWSVPQRTVIANAQIGAEPHDIYDVEFSPDGTLLAIADGDVSLLTPAQASQ